MSPRIGLQLFGLRNYQDFEAGLRRAAEIGYNFVEPFGWKPVVPTTGHFDLAQKYGMRCYSAHLLENQTWGDSAVRDSLLDRLVEHEARAWTFPGLGGDDEASICAIGEQVEDFYQEFLKPRGLGVEYHNHDSDMLPSHGGRAKLDILLEVAPSLTWQPDVGNFYLAGMTDTLQTLEAYRDRISSLHVKDIRSDYKERTHPCSALATGDGVVPLAPALVFCQQELGITDFIIEQEGFANNEGCDDMMTRSLAYLKEVLGSD